MGIVLVPNVLGDHGNKDYGMFSDRDEDEEHALIDKLPPGVIFPAPNFGDAINCKYKHYAGMNQYHLDAMGCVYEIFNYYWDIDFPQQRYGYTYGIFDLDDRKLVILNPIYLNRIFQ